MLAALMVAAACGGGDDSGGEQGGGGDTGGTGGTGEQGSGGGGDRLIVGYDQEPDILNGFITGGDLAATSDMTEGIVESPMQVSPDLEYVPELIDGEPEVVSEDPLTIEYTLQEGITFSDGEPLTSEDARWTYDQIMNPDNNIITTQGWELIENFETPDEQTVRMTFSEPYAPWRDLLLSGILPQHVYEGEDFNTALNNEVVGSGPYQLGEWRKGQDLTLEANENYWDGAPSIPEITFRFIPDTNTLLSAFENGEVQFINPPPDIGQIERLEGISGTTTQTESGTVWEHIAFNLEEIDDIRIRQAVAYGINREQILNEILPGQVEPLDSVLVPDQEDYYVPAWEDYGHDPEQASQLVEEAAAEGVSTEIRFSTTADNNLRETLQQVVQEQLREVGLTVNIDNTAAQTFFGEWTPEGNFSMGQWAWLAAPDPSSLTGLFSGNELPPDGQNYYRYQSEEFTQLVEQADVTVDEAERAELIQEAQRVMAEDMPLIPLFQRPDTISYVENLQGPEVNPTIQGHYWNVGEWSFSE